MSSYTYYVADAVGPLAYDGNSSTYASVPKIRQYIEVDRAWKVSKYELNGNVKVTIT